MFAGGSSGDAADPCCFQMCNRAKAELYTSMHTLSNELYDTILCKNGKTGSQISQMIDSNSLDSKVKKPHLNVTCLHFHQALSSQVNLVL